MTVFVGMFLINIVIGLLMGVVSDVVEPGGFMDLLLAMGLLAWFIACTIIGVGAAVRRFHDLDLSGWYVLLLVVPLVGFLTFLYLVFKPGKVGKTRWGEGVDDAQSTLEEFTAEVTQSKEEEWKAREVTEHGGKEKAVQEEAHTAWILAVVLVLGAVLAGYLAFAPCPTDAPEVTSAAIATPETTPAILQTPAPKPAADFTNSIDMEFVLIPAGEFEMGSPSGETDKGGDEGPVHRVTIEKAFYMGRYEVTQKQWQEVMGSNPSSFKGDDLPVESVSWDDVQKFIRKLNEKEGTDKYRLPSEAEWEYTCRAGTTTRYSFGDSELKLGDYAWYYDNSGDKTHSVGLKLPNPWGLCDMHGNVWEWTQDTYHSDYDGAPTDGSVWASGSGAYRVNRGGSWLRGAWGCRSALRRFGHLSRPSRIIGFRLIGGA